MKDHRSKENCPSWQPAPRHAAEQHQLQAHAGLASSSALAPFHFGAKRVQIDWRLLHGIDVNRMIRDTDLDTLERVVGVVAFGDLEGEDTCNLTDLNFLRIFRLSQLTAEYLLHVQDKLAQENAQLKGEGWKGAQHLEAVRMKVREQREAMAATNKELRRLKKTLKTYELLAEKAKADPQPGPTSTPGAAGPVPAEPADAAAAPAVGDPAPAVPAAPSQAAPQLPLPVPVPVAAPLQTPPVDPSLAWKLEKMELQVKDMKEEREGLLKDLTKLKAALQQLALRHQGAAKEDLATAVARTRREERLAADQRLTQALQNQQQRLQQQQQHQLQEQSQQQLLQRQQSAARRESSHLQLSLSESADNQALQQKLHEAVARQRDTAQQKEALELELLALRKSTGPGRPPIQRRGSQVLLGASVEEAVPSSPSVAVARADRLQRQLEEAEQQLDAMSIKIQQQEKAIVDLQQDADGEQTISQPPPANHQLVKQLTVDLDAAEGELAAMTQDRDQLQAVVADLEEKVAALELEVQQIHDDHQDSAEQAASPEALQRLEQQVRNLTEEMAALEAENGRLTEVITAEQPHNEELLMHVKELQHEVTVSRAQAEEAMAAAQTPRMQATTRFGETFRSFLPAARTSSTVLEVEFHPDMSPRPGPLEQGAIDSPQKLEELDKQEEEEEARAQALARHDAGQEEEEQGGMQDYPDNRQDSLEQEYVEQAQEARRLAREDAARAAEEGNHVEPLSGVAQRRLKQEMPYELQGRDVRPGVMSRFPHTFQAYQATLDKMQGELQGELEEELERYGIDPQATGMSDQQYSDAMADLQHQREQLLAGKPAAERRRILAMRNTMLWHLNNVGVRAQCDGRLQLGGEPSESAVTTEPSLARDTAPSLASNPSVRILPVRDTVREQTSRRLFGGRTTARAVGGNQPAAHRVAVTTRRVGPPLKRESSRSPDHLVREDLLAPVIPGRDADDAQQSEQEASALDLQDAQDQADRVATSTVRRRLLTDRGAASTVQGQRSSARLRDARQHPEDAAELDTGAQGEARPGSRLQPVGRALPAVRTGRNSVAFTTQPALPLSTRAGTTLTRPGAELSRPGADLGRARPALRTGLNQPLPSRAVPATPAPSPAGSPSIAAVYRPTQRSPEAQYRSSRLRPIASTRLRPLSEAGAEAGDTQLNLVAEQPGIVNVVPGANQRLQDSGKTPLTPVPEAEEVFESSKELTRPVEANIVAQPDAAQPVQPIIDGVSDVEEL